VEPVNQTNAQTLKIKILTGAVSFNKLLILKKPNLTGKECNGYELNFTGSKESEMLMLRSLLQFSTLRNIHNSK
jgi:hypothetical protein